MSLPVERFDSQYPKHVVVAHRGHHEWLATTNHPHTWAAFGSGTLPMPFRSHVPAATIREVLETRNPDRIVHVLDSGSGPRLDTVIAWAQRDAGNHPDDYAIGIETNDHTGLPQWGYCPVKRIGPAFVYVPVLLIRGRGVAFRCPAGWDRVEGGARS